LIPRTILMTVDAVGGVWTYATSLARALALGDIQVTLAVMGPPPSAAQIEDVRPIDVRHGAFKLEWMDDPWEDVDRSVQWLAALERELKPDLLHLNGYAHASVKTACPKLVVAHSCVLSWWEAVYGGSAPSTWNEYRRRVRAGIHSADWLVAPSRAMLSAIHKHYGDPCADSVIPNGCNPGDFYLAPKERFILTAGRFWDPAKNLPALDSAAAGVSWPIFAAGDGGTAQHLRQLGKLPAPELRSWLARASIFALPARYEPFGLAILEAAFSGCALVLGDIPSLRENWDGAAVFVCPNDPAGFADALRGLIDSPDECSRLQNEARIRARNFSIERMANSYLELYAALCSRTQPATARIS
jgi:glycogen(starch) synthase